jgi:hypothetical protein
MAERNVVPSAPERRKGALSEETVKDMVALQKADLEVRSKELDIRLHEMQSNAKTAESMIGAQERDREAQRVHVQKTNFHRLFFWGFIVLAITTLVILGMYLGRDALILDLTKIAAGILAGYGVGRTQAAKSNDSDD